MKKVQSAMFLICTISHANPVHHQRNKEGDGHHSHIRDGGGNTIHSTIRLTFKDRDGQVQEDMPQISDERRKQRWRRRKVLIVDEVTMLSLDTLYQKLRH